MKSIKVANEIKSAYRKLAREYHPDVNKSPDAEDKFWLDSKLSLLAFLNSDDGTYNCCRAAYFKILPL